MDVLGGSMNEYGLFRRRLRIDIPEINTYQRQILFCEKKYDKLNKKLHVPEVKNGASFTNSQSTHRPTPTECWSSNVAGPRGSRKSSLDNFHTGLSRRKSSFQQVPRKQSIPSSQKYEANRVSPQKFMTNRSVGRCSSESRVVATKGSLRHDSKQTGGFSRRASENVSRNGAEINKVVQECHRKQDQDSEKTKAEPGSTTAAFEELNYTLRLERDHFLRALTTLAIKRITTDKPDLAHVERNTTLTYYERNIDALADDSRLTFDGECIAPHLVNDNKNKDGSSASSSAGSDIYGPEGADEPLNPDKRERINRLKSYLKRSGFGDPNMVRTTIQQSEEEKRVFARLIRRINRGFSCEKKERLRRKARLEYEMSLMKGESFCEQQEQVYMRTASADMENRDVQLLEEELRIQALREIRQSQSKREKHGPQRNIGRQQSNSSEIISRGYDGRQVVNGQGVGDNGEQVEEGNQDNNLDEKTSSSEDRDAAMSGLIRNPVSRREMRKRILLWVHDVEEAMVAHQREGEKLEKKLFKHGGRLHNGNPDDESNERDNNAVATTDNIDTGQ